MMGVKNEVIVIIILVVFIIGFELITKNISDTIVNNFTKKQDEIMEMIYKCIENGNSKNNISKEIKNMKEEWFKQRNKLSIFIEHDELEKVTRSMIVFEENVKNEEYKIALENRN